MTNTLKTTCCVFLLLTVMSGCASLTGIFEKDVKFATAQRPAVEVICLWEPSEGKTPDGRPARGFEGTMLFFDRERTTPVAVHGEVTISVFDDYGPRETWKHPISEFTFSPEEWNTFLSHGTFGTTYRIFIPYMRKHPHQVKTSLSVSFVPASEGSALESRLSHVVLPGPLREGISPALAINAEIRDRSPEQLKQYVTESMVPKSQKLQINTIHSWKPGGKTSTGQIQLSNYHDTQGLTTGATSRFSKSASGADAESWGSTPPALSFTSSAEEIDKEEQPRRRFKLTP